MIDPTFHAYPPPEPDARTVAILDRLTAAHGVIDGFAFDEANPDDADEVLDELTSLDLPALARASSRHVPSTL
jgi:hypothetical protein